MPSSSFDRITEHLVTLAKDALVGQGEFRPLGATLDQEGDIESFAAAGAIEECDYGDHIEALKSHFRQAVGSPGIQTAGICFDVILHRDGERREAIQCSVESIDGEALDLFVPYSRIGSKVIDFHEGFTTARQRDIFGSPDFTLTLENRTPSHAPTLKQIDAAVDALTPVGGPGFLILEHVGGDYAQAAGGNGRFTAEWRTYLRNTFQHWVAGLGEVIEQGVAEIETNGCAVTVRSNEVLCAEDVKQILAAFAGGKARPQRYSWREITTSLASGDVPGTQNAT